LWSRGIFEAAAGVDGVLAGGESDFCIAGGGVDDAGADGECVTEGVAREMRLLF